MKRKMSLLCCLLFFMSNLYAISILDNKLYFDYPSNMEIKASKIDSSFNDGKIVFQQKSLNNEAFNSLDQYARIIIEISKARELVQDLFNNIEQLPKNLIDQLDFTLENFTKSSEYRIIDWYPIQIINITGNTRAIKTTYVRESLKGKNFHVKVNTYTFLIDENFIIITCSYRINDSYKYEYIIKDFLKSIKIN